MNSKKAKRIRKALREQGDGYSGGAPTAPIRTVKTPNGKGGVKLARQTTTLRADPKRKAYQEAKRLFDKL